MSQPITAYRIAGVGGFVIRQPNSVERVLTFVMPNGDLLNIGLTAEQLHAVGAKATELQTIEMETGEVMRDLGLYREG